MPETTPLAARPCVPCTGAARPLRAEDLPPLLAELTGWRVVGGHHLEKTLAFPDFRAALEHANAIAELADEAGHHPDLHVGWGRLGIEIFTHAVDGLTESDFVLAARIDGLRG